jgi:AcrR family transcriptional regulator
MNSEINLRDKILQAACKLIEEQGMTHFTLENIAQRANVSKGGLLYHFPSKEILVQAMIEIFLKELKSSLRKDFLLSSQENDRTIQSINWLKNYIHICFNQKIYLNQYKYAILAALTMDPKFLLPVRKFIKESQEEMLSLDFPTIATMIRLTCEGLWLSELFGFQMVDDRTRINIKQKLLDLLDDYELHAKPLDFFD